MPKYDDNEIRQALERLKERDPELYERASNFAKEKLKSRDSSSRLTESISEGFYDDQQMEEKIILEFGRPVLEIQDGDFVVNTSNDEMKEWVAPLNLAHDMLKKIIPSVGRINVFNHPKYPWLGTGWVVKNDIIVTNSHVARLFALDSNTGFVFQTFNGRAMSAEIDFLEEWNRSGFEKYPIAQVLYIEKIGGRDIAFLKIKRGNPTKPFPPQIKLAERLARIGEMVATIGYPANDGEDVTKKNSLHIFNDIYDKKRLAPGKVTGVCRNKLDHNCTTLGGNSGSALVSLETGDAVGLHYGGYTFDANFAVPSILILDRLNKIMNPNPIEIGRDPNSINQNIVASVGSAGGNDPSVTFTIPIQVTVQLGAATIIGQPAALPTNVSGLTAVDNLQRALQAAEQLKSQRPNEIMSVRIGYRFKGGWITDERVIVIALSRKDTKEKLRESGVAALPEMIEGVGVDVTTASPLDFLMESGMESPLFFESEAVKQGGYEPPAKFNLQRVKEKMRAVIHVSPDAGYPILSKFIDRIANTLTVGMYEFTADYIFDKLLNAVKSSEVTLNLVIQRFKNNAKGKDEMPVEDIVNQLKTKLKKRFNHAWASVRGPSRLFASAYHIKVAVRDHEEFWLSSGNWKPSGQPNCDPSADGTSMSQLLRSKNREWHVVIENKNLASQFERFLLFDLKEAETLEAAPINVPDILIPESVILKILEERVSPEARPFAPLEIKDRELDIQPLLTPDNYAEHVLQLIGSAKKRIYFQNQSLSPLKSNKDGFRRLLDALKEKQSAGVDVRIIFRDTTEFGGPDALRKSLESIKDYGFDTAQIKVQKGCHTKGVIVDGSVAMIGSHNWTNEGTLFNRDASLIFYDQEIAKYLEEIFLFDWKNLAYQKVNETAGPFKIDFGFESAENMARVPLTEIFG